MYPGAPEKDLEFPDLFRELRGRSAYRKNTEHLKIGTPAGRGADFEGLPF